MKRLFSLFMAIVLVISASVVQFAPANAVTTDMIEEVDSIEVNNSTTETEATTETVADENAIATMAEGDADAITAPVDVSALVADTNNLWSSSNIDETDNLDVVSGMPTSGNWYLGNQYTLGAPVTLSGDLFLYAPGNTIIGRGNDTSSKDYTGSFFITNGYSLTIMAADGYTVHLDGRHIYNFNTVNDQTAEGNTHLAATAPMIVVNGTSAETATDSLALSNVVFKNIHYKAESNANGYKAGAIHIKEGKRVRIQKCHFENIDGVSDTISYTVNTGAGTVSGATNTDGTVSTTDTFDDTGDYSSAIYVAKTYHSNSVSISDSIFRYCFALNGGAVAIEPKAPGSTSDDSSSDGETEEESSSTAESSSSASSVVYFRQYTGTKASFADALSEYGYDNSYEYRVTIAVANGISESAYRSDTTGKYNTELFTKYKAGTLIMPSTSTASVALLSDDVATVAEEPSETTSPATVNISGSWFGGCKARYFGGAVYAGYREDITLNISSSYFGFQGGTSGGASEANQAENGGAVAAECPANVSNTLFGNNIASGYKYNKTSTAVVVYGGTTYLKYELATETHTDNETYLIPLNPHRVSAYNSGTVSNRESSGGALFLSNAVSGSETNVTGCTFVNNIAGRNGGALAIARGTVNVVSSDFKVNKAVSMDKYTSDYDTDSYGFGGAIAVLGMDVTIDLREERVDKINDSWNADQKIYNYAENLTGTLYKRNLNKSNGVYTYTTINNINKYYYCSSTALYTLKGLLDDCKTVLNVSGTSEKRTIIGGDGTQAANVAAYGGGIYAGLPKNKNAYTEVNIKDYVDIAYNSTMNQGGGGYGAGVCSYGNLSIIGTDSENCSTINISNNTSESHGAGVFVASYFVPHYYVDGQYIFGADTCANVVDSTQYVATSSGDVSHPIVDYSWESLLTIENATINGNSAASDSASGGGIATWTREDEVFANIDNAVVTNNSVFGYGGAVCVGNFQGSLNIQHDPSYVTINGGTYSGNSAYLGGALYAHIGSQLYVNSAKAVENTDESLNSEYKIQNYTEDELNNATTTLISGNTTTQNGHGGGICVRRTDNSKKWTSTPTLRYDMPTYAHINKAIVANNTALYGGGISTSTDNLASGETASAVANQVGGTLITNSVIGGATSYKDGVTNGANTATVAPSATQGGGGIYAYSESGTNGTSTDFSIRDSEVSYNTSTSAGGGIYCYKNTLATIIDTNIDYNVAALNNTTVNLDATDTPACDYVEVSGGGLFARDSGTVVTISGGSVSYNKAVNGAGVAVAAYAKVYASMGRSDGKDSCTVITHNEASNSGGGAWLKYYAEFYLYTGTYKGKTGVTGLHDNFATKNTSDARYHKWYTLGDDIYCRPITATGAGTCTLHIPTGKKTLSSGLTAYWYEDYNGSTVDRFRVTDDPTIFANDDSLAIGSTVTLTNDRSAITLGNETGALNVTIDFIDVFNKVYDENTANKYTVTISGSTLTDPQTVSYGGTATFADLKPGTYTVTLTTADGVKYVKTVTCTADGTTTAVTSNTAEYGADNSKILDYVTNSTTSATVARSTATDVNFTNVVYAANVNINYYPRASVNNAPADMSSEALSITEKFVGADFITALGTTPSLSNTFSNMINAAGVVADNKVKLNNPVDDYHIYTSQTGAITGVSGTTYPISDVNNVKEYGDVISAADLTYHLDYDGTSTATDTNPEKWVTYKNISEDEIVPGYTTGEDVLVKDGGVEDVTDINVWLFNTPKEYTVRVYNSGDAATLEKCTGSDRYNLGAANTSYTFYYNQRFGGEMEENTDQNANTGHLGNYGLPGYYDDLKYDIAAQAYVVADNKKLEFQYWAFDANGTEIASTDLYYRNRVTRDTDLYAIYGESQFKDVGLSLSMMESDFYTVQKDDGTKVDYIKLNTFINPYNVENDDTNIKRVAAIYIRVRGTDVTTEQKIAMRTALDNYFTANPLEDSNPGSGSLSSSTVKVEEIEKYVINYVNYNVLHDDTLTPSDFDVILTNENRIHFSTAITKSVAKGCSFLAFAAMHYNNDKDLDKTIISDNCVEYNFSSDGELTSVVSADSLVSVATTE